MLKAFVVNKFTILIIAFFAMISVTSAQNSFGSSDELKSNAQLYFDNDNYIKAFPLYSQLLSLDRDDPDLLYRFGVCLLYSDRSDTYAPISYLRKALNHVSTPDIYYHLGFAHHINYDFPAAISYYREYQQRAGKKQKENFEVDRKIEMCRNGMEMMRSVKDLFVLDKSEVDRQEFFRSYELDNYGGKIIKKPEDFLSKEDAKSNTSEFMFFNSQATSVYYSGYGRENKKHLDIYVRYRTDEGWSSPERLPSIINTPYDENYPVMMPDGQTLYFSSKGHNTIGGYDIFKSVYNHQTKTWSVPENVNFPFNTPTDDILFVPDVLESTAWFASVRNSVEEKIMVYKVGIIKRPGGSEDMAAIYAKNKQISEDDLRAIKDRAKLDVNISQKEFEDVPNNESDLITEAENEHQENLQKISASMIAKQEEQAIIDSAKFLVNKLEKSIDSFDSLRQKASSLSASKRLESRRLRDGVKNNLSIASSASNLDGMKKAISIANNDMLKAEKLEYEALELDAFAKDIKAKVDQQRSTFSDINKRYGDAEQAVINGSTDRALTIIGGMNSILDEIPQIADIDNPINDGGVELNIQYPAEFNSDNFQAFVINTQQASPLIESYDVRYDEYIPKIESKQILSIETEYSNNPSTRIQQYISTLDNSRNSINIQVSELDRQIGEIKSVFETLSHDDQQNQIILLNQLEQEKGALVNQSSWMSNQVEDKQEQLRNLQLSSIDTDEKFDTYQSINSELESEFDFNKKIFKASTVLPNTYAYKTFSISEGNKLQETTNPVGQIKASNIEFTEANRVLIESQSTQLMAETRSLLKENQFLLRKFDNKANQLEKEANDAFNQATRSLQNARNSASESNKKTALFQANAKFKEAALIHKEFLIYNQKKEELSNTLENQEAIISKLNNDYESIGNAIKLTNYSSVENIYKSMENTHQNYMEMADFSAEIEYESGKIINTQTQVSIGDPFEITSSGQIIKTIGNTDSEWNSFEIFSKEIDAEKIELVLSPNIDLTTRQSQFTEIFQPQQSVGELFNEIDIEIPNELISSENSLVDNSVNQINSLELKLNELIRKRNIVDTYYKNQLSISSELELESLELLNANQITTDIVLKSNQLAQESIKELYKASVAAFIIRQYDEKIDAYASVLNQSINTTREINELVINGNQDDALLKNVQFQREISAIDRMNINDSDFNFSEKEINRAVPEDLLSGQNAAYLIVDGQVQRNNFSEINRLFFEESYPVKVTSFNELEQLINTNSTTSNAIVAQTNTDNSTAAPINFNQSDIELKDIDIQSYPVQEFNSPEDYRQALSDLNTYSQNHISQLNSNSVALTLLAEEKLNKSNEFSLQSERALSAEKRTLQDSAKKYLNEALLVKKIIESFDEFIQEEEAKQNEITEATFEIENKLKSNDLTTAQQLFISMQQQTSNFKDPSKRIESIKDELSDDLILVSQQMDSAYNLSQELANQSVKLLSEASEERESAEGKRNAFKRREHLRLAEEKEIEATRLQNESEKALNSGNLLYQQKAVLSSLSLGLATELKMTSDFIPRSLPIANNQEVLFDNLDNKRAEVFEGQLNTASIVKPENQEQNTRLAETDDIHVYQRENFKAEMISEELDLLKREIALLVQSQNQDLSERENYVVSKKIDLLRQKADSLEYEANKAFEFANRVLESLSDDDQEKAQDSGRDFDTYLTELKQKIELLLSEAASLKQRAQRSNNVNTREELFNQAKEKEEVAMYLILEEFEVIAQKNKTRYRRNQLILEQLLMDKASPEERELMRNIFAQIDQYFAQAEEKRKKANESGTSFNMKKILLQDAYSLEMKALDLQQQAKTMIEENDRDSMLAYQKDEEQETLVSQDQVDNSQAIKDTSTENNNNNIETNNTQNNRPIPQDIPLIADENGTYYKVQFSALKELKKSNDFPGINEITAQRVEGTDYIRYFSGKFDDINNAIIRRNSVRASGYSDAFIKSWRNGEETQLLSLDAGNDNTSSSVAPAFTTERSINNIDFSATSISSLQGVYYTVQVGVYSRPRTSAMIFGISPLYHKRMDNGFWIYYSGIFNSIADAENKKEQIRQLGVDDAFVVAFSNGDQVGLSEARQKISRGEETPSDDAIVILEDASIQLNRQWNQTQSNTTISSETSDNGELVYKVQVGVYSNPINLNWISTQLDNNNPVERYQNTNGKYVYTVGDFTTESEARALLRELSDIVPDAFLVGFQNGQKKYIR